MDAQQLIAAAAAGAVFLAMGSALFALSVVRSVRRRLERAWAERDGARDALGELAAAAEAFDQAILILDGPGARLAAGREALAACAAALRADPEPGAVLAALAAGEGGPAIEALASRGEGCVFEAAGPGGVVRVEGRASGALLWLKLRADRTEGGGLPAPSLLARFIDVRGEPAWVAAADGRPIWANRAWLAAAGAASLEDALARGLTIDRRLDALAREAVAAGAARSTLRFATASGARRAFRITATPMAGALAAMWISDVTEAQTAADAIRRAGAAHEAILALVSDAVAVFGRDQRLIAHNPAFAAFFGLEAAWLGEGPSHGEILDRLRQRRRLPETSDYRRFRTEELTRHANAGPAPEVIWRLPSGRMLRVASLPHPAGGIAMIFCDITPELQLKTQFNQLIQVQKATLDKLSDAVAVFGAEGRLKLHNEAFETFWGTPPGGLGAQADFDAVMDQCLARFHDLQFWRELKARITDPDPAARSVVSREIVTADRRIVAFQSRPLPDGATLISFSDVTDARRLEGALADRESALADTERLKREFVGSVSYELRTPLTTILGYAELLEGGAASLGERARGYVEAVRTAATQLARSIDNVLDMAQIDAGEMALDVADVDVSSLLAEAAQRWSRRAQAGELELEVAAHSQGGLIRGDARRLSQAIDHLTDNALRHTPAGGTVSLSAERSAGHIRLRVADTGRGIPFHVQAHIFDRFSGQTQGGPGLGLALVKAIVELHGGWVELESEPGAGACFTCHLPEAAQAQASRPELFGAA